MRYAKRGTEISSDEVVFPVEEETSKTYLLKLEEEQQVTLGDLRFWIKPHVKGKPYKMFLAPNGIMIEVKIHA